MAKAAAKTTDLELVLSSNPAEVMEQVRDGNAELVPTRQLNIFYVLVDVIEKRVKYLKEKARQTIIDRRNEGEPAGDKNQHREFAYNTPQGRVELTIQERNSWRMDVEKMTDFLHQKHLWDTAATITIKGEGPEFRAFVDKYRHKIEFCGASITEELDLDKVDGLCKAKLISLDEFEYLLDKKDPTYALIPKLKL
jgi:hypothetical protein